MVIGEFHACRTASARFFAGRGFGRTGAGARSAISIRFGADPAECPVVLRCRASTSSPAAHDAAILIWENANEPLKSSASSAVDFGALRRAVHQRKIDLGSDLADPAAWQFVTQFLDDQKYLISAALAVISMQQHFRGEARSKLEAANQSQRRRPLAPWGL
jgi:hypothetical protein